jgi:hypothetical protein
VLLGSGFKFRGRVISRRGQVCDDDDLVCFLELLVVCGGDVAYGGQRLSEMDLWVTQ